MPDLDDLRGRLCCAKEVIAQQFKPDESRQGILGISMGAKQALAVLLKEKDKAGFSVLGLLSGMFQDPHLKKVKD
jgi:predicted peptidase